MITRKNCRVCQGSLTPILSFGSLYVSDFLLPDDNTGTQAPLELVLCQECHLLQLKHTVAAEQMFKNYWYRSGTNQSMRDALRDITSKAEQLISLEAGDAVLDIGCNDGTLLDSYQQSDLFKIGFDPAENLAILSREVANKVVTGFFAAEAFQNDRVLTEHRPKIVTSIAMFYDLENPQKFVSDVKEVMHPEGLWIMQMSYLPLMLEQNEFGNICHEHLEYYSLHSLEYLLSLHGLQVVDVELNDVNGGSFRLYIRRESADADNFAGTIYRTAAGNRLAALRQREARLGLDTTQPYLDFADRVKLIKKQVVDFINEETMRGRSVYVYGASTKGNTVLQYFGLDHTLITAAAERNPNKWGKVTVGSRIPIISEAEVRAARPDYLLVLPWHFLEEFKEREKEYLESGGKFIVPMPQFSLFDQQTLVDPV